jgi:hypothetical protein
MRATFRTEPRLAIAVDAKREVHEDGPTPRAFWLLASTIVGTTVLQLTRARSALTASDPIVTPGLDFHTLIWAPARGLVAGFNPYETPANPRYVELFGPALPSSPRPPFLLLLEGPLAIPPTLTGYQGSVILNCLVLWAGMLFLAHPSTSREMLSLAGIGSAVVLSGPADMLLGLGQVTPWAVLGLGLVARRPRSWLGAVGIALLLIVPQVGVGIALLLLVLGRWRLVLAGWVTALALSLPALVPAVIAAGGLTPFTHGLAANIALQSGTANSVNRVDMGGLVAGTGLVALLPAVVILGVVAIVLHGTRPPLDLTLLLSLVATVTVALYHMPYHLPLLLAVTAAVLVRNDAGTAVKALGWILIGVGVLTSFALVPLWAASTGFAAVVWTLLLICLTVVPAALALVALVSRVLDASKPPAVLPRATGKEP